MDSRDRTTSKRPVVALVVVILLVAAILLTIAGPASASYSYRVVGTGGIGVCRRTAPALGALRDGCIPEGNWVAVDCWVIGETVVDYWQGRRIGWNRWARTPDSRYIADIYLSSTATSYPQCGGPPPPAPSTRESRAVNWAKSQLGVRYTNLTPDGMFSGWCQLFVELAYGTRGRYASAMAAYNAQRAAGRIHYDTSPEYGALVFYRWGSYGHVGLAIGGGQVISTQGVNTPLPVRQHTVTGLGLPFLGWSVAPPNWPGR
jgi:hypothetical protein